MEMRLSEKTPQILFVEDEPNLLNSLSYILESDGFVVKKALSAEEAVIILNNFVPDVVLLDVMLPGISGLELAAKIKKNPTLKHTFIIMQSGIEEEDDVISALENYADDYITKPVKPRMLIARINAVLRRAGKKTEVVENIEHGAFLIDVHSRKVFLDKTEIELTKSEFDILALLASQQNHVFSRNRIIGSLHGDDFFVTERSIDFLMFSLRKKLHSFGEKIETVRGVGYRFNADD